MKNSLVNTLQTPSWVGWKKVKIKNRWTKQPRYKESPASSTNPHTWMMYEEARRDVGTLYDGVGFIISSQHTQLLGIDLDHVLTSNKSLTRTDVMEFLQETNTYTEVSPSGDGLHVVFKIKNPQKLKANKKTNDDGTAFECYTDGRYFTFTGEVYHEYKTVREVSMEEAENCLALLGYPWGKSQHIASIASSPSVPNMTDDEVLEKAFTSTNGEKIKTLWNGNTDKYHNDASSADLALCSHLAFWSGRPEQVERLWIASPLGQRQKTQERQDYRKMTIDQVFSTKTEFYNPVREICLPDALLSKNKSKKKSPKLIGKEGKDNTVIVKPILENVIRLMCWDERFYGELRFNEFSQKIQYRGQALEDRHVIEIWAKFQVAFPEMSNVSKNIIQDAVVVVAQKNTYNPITDWLNSLKWDGVKRLDELADQVFGYPAEDTDDFVLYRESVGTIMVKSLVARALQPGVKYDHMIVLEGKQGCGKSTFIQALAGTEFVYETIAKDITDKDFHINTSEAWIVHFDEGESLKYGSVESLKHMITSQKTTVRLPYARNDVTIPKKYTFMMSTNDAQYLRDKTGNRRFLPLKIYLDFVDIQWFRENRDQLFAEAVHLWKTDKTFHVPEIEASRQQEQRMMVDPIDALVEEYLSGLDEKYLSENGIIHKEIWESEYDRDPSRNDIIRIHSSLANLGFYQKQVRENGKQVRKWFKKQQYNA